MAPEVVSGEKGDARSDLYAVGASVGELDRALAACEEHGLWSDEDARAWWSGWTGGRALSAGRVKAVDG